VAQARCDNDQRVGDGRRRQPFDEVAWESALVRVTITPIGDTGWWFESRRTTELRAEWNRRTGVLAVRYSQGL
jgi:hypothetical protein